MENISCTKLQFFVLPKKRGCLITLRFCYWCIKVSVSWRCRLVNLTKSKFDSDLGNDAILVNMAILVNLVNKFDPNECLIEYFNYLNTFEYVALSDPGVI